MRTQQQCSSLSSTVVTILDKDFLLNYYTSASTPPFIPLPGLYFALLGNATRVAGFDIGA
jgi:hypothetical protein